MDEGEHLPPPGRYYIQDAFTYERFRSVITLPDSGTVDLRGYEFFGRHVIEQLAVGDGTAVVNVEDVACHDFSCERPKDWDGEPNITGTVFQTRGSMHINMKEVLFTGCYRPAEFCAGTTFYCERVKSFGLAGPWDTADPVDDIDRHHAPKRMDYPGYGPRGIGWSHFVGQGSGSFVECVGIGSYGGGKTVGVEGEDLPPVTMERCVFPGWTSQGRLMYARDCVFNQYFLLWDEDDWDGYVRHNTHALFSSQEIGGKFGELELHDCKLFCYPNTGLLAMSNRYGVVDMDHTSTVNPLLMTGSTSLVYL